MLVHHGFLRGQAPQAAQCPAAAGSWSEFVGVDDDGHRLGASSASHEPQQPATSAHAPRPTTTTAASSLSPDDFLKLLDELTTTTTTTATTSGPGTAPPNATPVSPLAHSLSTGPPSPSLFASAPLFPPPAGHPFAAASLDPVPASSWYSLAKDQAAPQLSTSSFTSSSKPFDAGDILMPFDLEPAAQDSVATAPPGPLDLLALPVFDTAHPSTAAPFDPVALDAMLESPLGLASAASVSPLSEFLASPLFSLAGDSTVPSATMSELPLPSPYDAALSAPLSASADGPALAWFPPLPASSSAVSAVPQASSLLFESGAGAPPTPASTVLRPLPPPLPTPTFAAPALPPAAAAAAAKGAASSSSKRPAPTGFRPGAPPLLPLDAPVQSRHSVLPSATSKKRKTSAAEKALAKRGRTASATPAPDSGEGVLPAVASGGGGEHDDNLPADIVAAVERKRLQNTLSARKSRARKQARMQELEGENEVLRRRVAELEALLGLSAVASARGGGGGGGGAA